MSDFSNKNALITGASRGIGRATAIALALRGANVLIHYGRDAEAAHEVVAEIRKTGGRAESFASDFTNPASPHALAERACRYFDGSLDIFVANAGIAHSALLRDTRIEDFDRLMAINVRAPYFLIQQLEPIMREGGSIVLLSSLASRSPVGDISAYAATKGAVDTLVKHFAHALAQRSIRVNGVAPGVVDTDMSSFVRTAEGRKFVLGLQGLKRIAQPEDIADVVVFLTSEGARWVNGDIVQVDGGTKL
ncbi:MULTISPECIES: glucose 1-dehydrogenase [unclassified Caballeronia]|uniref:SDR family NAD(P)-dependent oxidoreductase n=1 Tax=unclassified Caballeronia TaxID=2646786 RepID=UPI00285FB438|nr:MULTISPECIES: glucose 1-dehydrogenase [unclassified Caballeronia]MDR5740581.1 glucose 1-dehydrogenase [Caballeronia sp. LZ016]MDR5808897.1 glucose 1-dehydrogenase [Caballeronia sp. LZ019]